MATSLLYRLQSIMHTASIAAVQQPFNVTTGLDVKCKVEVEV